MRSISHDTQLVSVVVPVFNEIDNVELMYHELVDAMESQHRRFELVVVDDGSRDGTTECLKQMAEEDQRLKLVLFRRNFGQTAAMHAGIQHAEGQYIVTIDGDLQNDPRDIPKMLAYLDQGYDLVHGWRKNRQDHLLSRKIPSRIANWIISRTTDFPIHDLGCTLKAMKSEIAQQLELYGEMHRFIPILAHQLGAKSIEVVTNHRERKFGETKYGLGRTFRVVLDLITVNFMLKYFASPMKLFGKLGLIVGAAGCGSILATIAMKLFGTDMTGNPLLLLGVLAVLVSVQFFSLGIIGEVCARIYYKDDLKRTTYQVREFVNFAEPTVLTFRTQRAA